jgi:hypothetical protein
VLLLQAQRLKPQMHSGAALYVFDVSLFQDKNTTSDIVVYVVVATSASFQSHQHIQQAVNSPLPKPTNAAGVDTQLHQQGMDF